jgi:hypothetical protein
MYLVLVEMEKRYNGQKTSRTLEIREETPLRAKQAAMAQAKKDYGSEYMDFKIKSCQKDR